MPLRALPFTLVHGNFWEGCLLLDEDAELVVLDWGLAGIGPGVLDLATLVMRGRWECLCPAEQAAETVAAYRAEIQQRLGYTWDEAAWATVWDHAVLWRFLQEILIWAASTAPDAFAGRAEAFQAVWLEPVLAAARRRLAP
jgi:aminoglycoside phosphotransferase (APT) family kinase protein